MFSLKRFIRPSWSYSSIGPATFWLVKKILFTMCTAAVHLGLQLYNWSLLINLVWDYPHNALLVTLGTTVTDMISSVYNFLVLNFCTQGFLWGCFFAWKLDPGRRWTGQFFCQRFCFSVHRFRLNFFFAKLWMNDRVNMLLCIQKFFSRKKK